MHSVRVLYPERTEIVGKILCVGKNYAEHAKEMGCEPPKLPIIFLKPASSLCYTNQKIAYPKHSKEMHYEAELVLLIGKKIKEPSLQDAEDAIVAYAVGLDMTLRDLQNEFKLRGEPWTLSKVFDNSAVVSYFIPKGQYNFNPEDRIILKVNGVVKQNSQMKNMIFKPAEIVKFIADRMTLEPGDLIFTGTPEGVGKVEPGDTLEAYIENLTDLRAYIT